LGVVVDRGRSRPCRDVTITDVVADDVRDEDVIDELALAAVDPGVPLSLPDTGGQVPQPGAVP
jgi:hypothetical protein